MWQNWEGTTTKNPPSNTHTHTHIWAPCSIGDGKGEKRQHWHTLVRINTALSSHGIRNSKRFGATFRHLLHPLGEDPLLPVPSRECYQLGTVQNCVTMERTGEFGLKNKIKMALFPTIARIRSARSGAERYLHGNPARPMTTDWCQNKLTFCRLFVAFFEGGTVW